MNDGLGSVQSVLVLGGGSDIGLATVRALGPQRLQRVVLAARDPETLAGAVPNAELVRFDALDGDSHDAVIDAVFDAGDIDLVLVAFGVLGDQDKAEADAGEAARIVHTNYLGAVTALTAVARRMESQGHGTIVVLSSVAGERARRSNFVYGSSKAGLDAFAQGLGDRLVGTGVHVMVVRPGFVHTKMTAGMEPVPFSTTPEKVAAAIVDGVRRGANTVWVPSVLRYVMSGLRHVPRAVFRRLPV